MRARKEENKSDKNKQKTVFRPLKSLNNAKVIGYGVDGSVSIQYFNEFFNVDISLSKHQMDDIVEHLYPELHTMRS